MKIWLQSSVMMPTPPTSSGGLEYIVARLAGAFRDLGHEVTLIGLDGSGVVGVDVITVPRYRTPYMSETALIDRIEKTTRAAMPDVLFDHSLYQLAQVRWPKLSAVTMSHGEAKIPLHAKNPVFCSRSHGRWHGREKPVALHIGIDPADFEVGPRLTERGAPLIMSRMMPYKRIHLAVDLCQRAGLSVDVAGPVADQSYYDREVGPRLLPRGHGRPLGEVGGRQRIDLLSQAACLLFFSEAKEPSGTAMLEAMASGTPVFAFNHGANPEYVRQHETGFLAASEADMVDALTDRAWEQLDARRCREHVEENFSIQSMAQRAIRLLQRAKKGEGWR